MNSSFSAFRQCSSIQRANCPSVCLNSSSHLSMEFLAENISHTGTYGKVLSILALQAVYVESHNISVKALTMCDYSSLRLPFQYSQSHIRWQYCRKWALGLDAPKLMQHTIGLLVSGTPFLVTHTIDFLVTHASLQPRYQSCTLSVCNMCIGPKKTE